MPDQPVTVPHRGGPTDDGDPPTLGGDGTVSLKPSGKPLYRQIADDLRRAIYEDTLKPGSQLPSERELIERYGVSRNTIRLALGILANEGLIQSGRGQGSFVRDRAMLTYHASRAEAADRPDDWRTDAYHTEVRQQGREPSTTFDMRVDPATVDVAQRLDVEEGAAVVVRRVMRHVDGEAWSIQDSFYPMDISQECGLLVPHDIPRGTVRVMAEHGYMEVGYVDEITTRMPTPDEARVLNLGAGTPVLVYVRTCYTKDRPVRVTQTTFAGDRNRLVYELGQLEAIYGRP